MDGPEDRDGGAEPAPWESMPRNGDNAWQVETCEVRWIRPGPLEPDVAAWFARFPSTTEVREDAYLVTPHLAGLSVKIRGGETLDVKQHRNRVGELAIAGAATGPIDSWLKLSFLLERPIRWPPDPAAASWRRVEKRRRISRFGVRDCNHAASEHDDRSECSVELTEVRTGDEKWWTLAFEAISADPVTAIQRTAAIIFSDPLPTNRELRAHEATPYAQWIQQRR